MPVAGPVAGPVAVPEWLEADPRYVELATVLKDTGRAAAQYGTELFHGGDPARAAPVLEAAVTLAPQQALYWGNYATALAALGKREQAVEMFNRSLSIDPSQYRIWLNLAHILVPLNRPVEAEEAFRYALNSTDTRNEALTGLGLLAMRDAKYEEASTHFRRVKAYGGTGALLDANIGTAAFQRGNIGEALVAYDDAAAQAPAEAGYRNNALFLRMLHGVMTGNAEQAVTAFAKPLADDTVLQDAFRRAMPFLTGFGHIGFARALAAEWLGYYPNDIEARYLSAVLNGASLDRTPKKYLTSLFDRMADQLDDRFFNQIAYHVPEVMAASFAKGIRKGWKGDLLDAGCGTGILGPLIMPFAKSLSGVDLAPRMLDRARLRGVYGELVRSDMVEYLTAQPHSFDAIFAAEVLIYKGTLDYVMRAVSAALRPGGFFVFDIATMDEGTYALQPSGRFQHAKAYVTEALKGYFTIIESQELDLRREAENPVRGAIFVAKRK